MNSADCPVELLWLPVGAGTSRFQQASLRAWEAFEAARARRPRMRLVHAALRLACADGRVLTLEMTPAFVGGTEPPLMTGPVGFRGADRLRLFRYQLRCLPVATLPDEQWAIDAPVVLAGDCGLVERILELAPALPRHTWGRRAHRTREMWTSDSAIAWLLVKAGADLAGIGPPDGARAPGWFAGIRAARRGGA